MWFWKHHVVFPENWLQRGWIQLKMFVSFCQAMPYGWIQCKHFVGPAVPWTIARPLRHTVPPRRSMQGWNQGDQHDILTWKRVIYIVGKKHRHQIEYDSFFPLCLRLKWQTKGPTGSTIMSLSNSTWFSLSLSLQEEENLRIPTRELWALAWTLVSCQAGGWNTLSGPPPPRPVPQSQHGPGPQLLPGEKCSVLSKPPNLQSCTEQPGGE